MFAVHQEKSKKENKEKNNFDACIFAALRSYNFTSFLLILASQVP